MPWCMQKIDYTWISLRVIAAESGVLQMDANQKGQTERLRYMILLSNASNKFLEI